jgi:kynurenine 3-monooxygenase
MTKERVIIIGAGLAGSLLAIYLAKRGIAVEVYEARSDMRTAEVAAGRSINLALSDRGIAALREVGMDEYMLAEAVPMLGRMIHSVSGDTKLLPYSGRQGEYINSVSRAGLNIALMNEAEKYPNARFYFDDGCVGFDCATGEAKLASGKTVKGDTLIATDGAGSAVREAMRREIPGFELSQVFLEHGYKELHIPPKDLYAPADAGATDKNDNFLLEKNALHIWPRHKFMMIALPNFDGSFTCTLFLDKGGNKGSTERVLDKGGNKGSMERVSEGLNDTLHNSRVSASDPSFDQITDRTAILDFFQTEFPDAIPLMPTLEEDFAANPVGLLGTVKCYPWHAGGKALLLGDSAHALVPFYGQGMNCAFEDCRVLEGLIEKHGADWNAVFEEYQQARKINTDAIADMAEENFYEMRDATADPVFQRKRELETKLEQTFPDYFSKYSMVTFREDLPYSVAKEKGNAQDKLLMEICAKVEAVKELDLAEVMDKVKKVAVP